MTVIAAVIAVLGILGTLIGTLGSQCIAAKTTLRTKRLELFYARKADAYKALLEKAAEYGADPKNVAKFITFQAALHAALLVASDKVADALDNPRSNSLHMNAVRLRTAESADKIQAIQIGDWYKSMETLKAVMRADLAGFG